ncbi:uncharacterized protein CIMG_01327 [Coccidioides immitis RS]|nr:uncharacterized protein CIMG_01327 [Coccidioides immitis RS]EAS35973.3 hypothetical protein CIMG_01327 [Coccidioides immitis RS]
MSGFVHPLPPKMPIPATVVLLASCVTGRSMMALASSFPITTSAMTTGCVSEEATATSTFLLATVRWRNSPFSLTFADNSPTSPEAIPFTTAVGDGITNSTDPDTTNVKSDLAMIHFAADEDGFLAKPGPSPGSPNLWEGQCRKQKRKCRRCYTGVHFACMREFGKARGRCYDLFRKGCEERWDCSCERLR